MTAPSPADELAWANDVLARLGVPNDGRPLAERIPDLLRPLDPEAADADVKRILAALEAVPPRLFEVASALRPYVVENQDLKAALAAAQDMNRKLLDPEFTFGKDSMGVVDGRGLVRIMVNSFDEMMRAGGAENFMAFEVKRQFQLAYVVTVQKATGKTPAECYIEAARELAALKGTEPKPLPPEDPEEEHRTPQPDDHLWLDLKKGCYQCDHCGKEQGFTQPIAGNDLKALGDSFGARHKLCPAPARPAPAPVPQEAAAPPAKKPAGRSKKARRGT